MSKRIWYAAICATHDGEPIKNAITVEATSRLQAKKAALSWLRREADCGGFFLCRDSVRPLAYYPFFTLDDTGQLVRGFQQFSFPNYWPTVGRTYWPEPLP